MSHRFCVSPRYHTIKLTFSSQPLRLALLPQLVSLILPSASAKFPTPHNPRPHSGLSTPERLWLYLLRMQPREHKPRLKTCADHNLPNRQPAQPYSSTRLLCERSMRLATLQARSLRCGSTISPSGCMPGCCVCLRSHNFGQGSGVGSKRLAGTGMLTKSLWVYCGEGS